MNEPKYIKTIREKINAKAIRESITVEEWIKYFRYHYKKRKLTGNFKQIYTENTEDSFYRVRRHIPPYLFISDNEYRVYSISQGNFKELKINLDTNKGREYISINNKIKYTISLSMLVLLAYGNEEQASREALELFDKKGMEAFHYVECHHTTGYIKATGTTTHDQKNNAIQNRIVNCDPNTLQLLTDEQHDVIHPYFMAEKAN